MSNLQKQALFIDFHKAFDSLELDYHLKCREYFNFGRVFISWVKICYKNVQSCAIKNGFLFDYFYLEQGVIQGDPLFPHLFVIAVESLAIVGRQNAAIVGITIEKEEAKLVQYADDTTAILSDINSAQALFNILDKFERISGLMLNLTKTKSMWIGSPKTKPFDIKWLEEPMKGLAVFCTYEQKL